MKILIYDSKVKPQAANKLAMILIKDDINCKILLGVIENVPYTILRPTAQDCTF